MGKRKTAVQPDTYKTEAETSDPGGKSRREFLTASAVGLAATSMATGVLSSAAPAEAKPIFTESSKKRILLKGGVVLTLDPNVGDFEKADVLIEGKKIVAVGPNLRAGGAQEIDCRGTIVCPGFISTHHHQYYTIQRGINADGFIVFGSNPPSPFQQPGAWPFEAYSSIQNIWTAGRIGPATAPTWDMMRPPYDPEDLYISELAASLSQITQGLTMGTDTSQASHTPAHTDAMIQGIMDSGRRTLYDYSNGTNRSAQDPSQPNEYPGAIGNTTSGIGRLARQYFNSKDQLVTLGFPGGPTQLAGTTYTGWQLGREFGAFLNAHSVGAPQSIVAAAADPRNGTDWSDVTRVHAVRWQDNSISQPSYDSYTNASQAWQILADRGGHVSIAVIIEMQMRHGMPPFQMALNHGILPSLSPDVDTNMTPDPFSMMRGAFCIQRALANDLAFAESNPDNLPVPQVVTCRQVLEMMTVAGAAGSGVLDKVGTLTPGKEADIVVLDTANLNIAPVNNAPGAIVTMMDTRHVRDVLIAGKVVFRNGSLVGWNAAKIVRDLEKSRERVLARIRGPGGDGSGPGRIGSIPKGMNSEGNPYRPNFLGSCCYNGQNPLAPHYVLRP